MHAYAPTVCVPQLSFSTVVDTLLSAFTSRAGATDGADGARRIGSGHSEVGAGAGRQLVRTA
jgi:hypothetical protein